MKQIVRRVIDRKGRVAVIDVPEPHVGPDQVLIRSHYSLISSGTEMSTLSKTPAELVRQTISDPWMRNVVKDTLLATGLGQTGRRVLHEMMLPREIGYSGAGRVLAMGANIEGIEIGDKIAYASAGHAEMAAPHANHVVRIPETVDLRHAAFVTVGGIALQSVRRAELQLGEVVAVFGLGLVGQLCAQIAKAAGGVVVGIDVSDERCALAAKCGIDYTVNPAKTDLNRRIQDITAKHGVDATIICASSKSSDLINSATAFTRKQGRIVIVGYVGLDIHPKNFLYQELDIRYSRAYGPGSYDNSYEKGRIDYPFGYVRWTEQRNLAEIIRLIEQGALRVEPLIGDVYTVDRVQEAFDAIRAGTLRNVAALIEYDVTAPLDRRKRIPLAAPKGADGRVGLALVGVGNHVLGKILPNLKADKRVAVRSLVSATGKNASMVAEDLGVASIASDLGDVLREDDIDAVLVCSSQPDHAEHVCEAIRHGKALFVEKPMVTTFEDYRRVAAAMAERPVPFLLGLNRRYSPMLAKLKAFVGDEVDAVEYLIAQTFTPPSHWSLDPVDGAGRLVAEGEHFIDICHALIGQEPVSVFAKALGPMPDDLRTLCNFAVTIHYERAAANIVFNESKAAGFPRERITAMGRGVLAELDDFGALRLHGRRFEKKGSDLAREMGHKQALTTFVDMLTGAVEIDGWKQASRATLTMFAAQESLRTGEPVDLRQFEASVCQGGNP